MHTDASTRPRALLRLAWLGVVLLTALLTLLAVHLIDRSLHRAYVAFRGPKQSLRLVTWNLGKVYLRWESRASDRDMAYVAQVIREVNPHVVALQEIRDAAQLDGLVTNLGGNWRGKVPEDAYDRHAALLIRLPGRFFELPTSTGRTAQGAAVQLPGGRSITVVSVHLDAFEGERRLHQAEEIVTEASRFDSQEVFLAGDFNIDPEDPTSDAIDHRLYRFLSSRLTDAARQAGATTLAAQRLDYVFYRSQHADVAGARVLRNRRINSMDHHPLVVEFDLHQ